MWNLYFIKTNDTGYAICHEIPRNITDTSIIIVQSNFPCLVTSGAEVVTDSITTSSLLYTDSVICQNIVTEINDIADYSLLIYPNPFNETACIKINNDDGNEYLLEVFSSEGIKVHQHYFRGNMVKFSKGNLRPGLYLFRISGNNDMASGRLILME